MYLGIGCRSRGVRVPVNRQEITEMTMQEAAESTADSHSVNPINRPEGVRIHSGRNLEASDESTDASGGAAERGGGV